MSFKKSYEQILLEMAGCLQESENVYIKRFITPHCNTCSCPTRELEMRHKYTIPYTLPIPLISESARHHSNSSDQIEDFYCCYQCQKYLSPSLPCVHDCKKIMYSNHKYSLLYRWFTRFDSNNDGYLDLWDLQSLLKHLGAHILNTYVKRLIQAADIDADGRLSFLEFLHMWHEAAIHSDDFSTATGCCYLLNIIKEYQLYPEIQICNCCHQYCASHMDQTKCSCGQKKVTPFLKNLEKGMDSFNITKMPDKQQTEDTDKLPVFSCNRTSLFKREIE